MNSNPEPENSSGKDFEWPFVEEFAKWLNADPENYEHWSRIVEEAAKGGYGELTPDLRAAAEHFVAKRHEAECIKAVQTKFTALQDIMLRPAGSMSAEDRLAQCNALMDELTDALLETPEPHRDSLLKQVLPLREFVRSLKVEE